MQQLCQGLRCFSSHSPLPLIQNLSEGLVLIKKLVSPDVQVKLAKDILEMGADPLKGFWRIENGQKVLNSRDYRGRMFGQLSTFPTSASEVAERALKIASSTDQTLRFMLPTHMIALFYKTLQQPPPSGYIPWHRDNGENDGSVDFPVLSLTIGDSCDFLINNDKPRVSPESSLVNPANLSHRVLFESGDALIFGGPKRYMWHSIYKIHEGTAPPELPFSGARLNLTLRYVPEIIGKEDRYATIPADKIPRDNPFYSL